MKQLPNFRRLFNPGAVPLEDVPRLEFSELRSSVIKAAADGLRVSAFFAAPDEKSGELEAFAVMSSDRDGRIVCARSPLPERFASLTPECPQVHLFEREIAETWGAIPEGHPWLKPVRYRKSLRPGKSPWGEAALQPGGGEFYKIAGDEIHEVAVGPVHAGVIEPGHFRFQCHGEKVFNLEIALGYQHRGAEDSLRGGPDKRSVHFAETVAGDSSIAHASAYCGAIEALAGIEPSPRAHAVRAVALELERIANHVGDLGALAGDVAFLPTASYCGRIRGEYLNMSACICGNRFGRNLVRPGGVALDLDAEIVKDLLTRLDKTLPDTVGAMDLMWASPSVIERLEGTGPLSKEDCARFGFVGVAARASGVELDVRFDHPWGSFRFEQIPVSNCVDGDVLARAMTRDSEIRRSASFVKSMLDSLPQGQAKPQALPSLAPDSLAVSLVEGWRGEICHAAVTGKQGRFRAFKIVDPSFHNWLALALCMKGEEVSNFPICNKSFNLSYCGHDL